MKDKQRSTSQVEDKHTPGPWKVTDDGCIYFKDGFIGEAYQFNPGLYGEKQEDAPMTSNARLMAAAPEMLEILKESVWYIDFGDSGAIEWHEQMEKLIAKIEGDE